MLVCKHAWLCACAQAVARFNSIRHRVSLSPAGNALLLSFLASKKLTKLSELLSHFVLIRVVDTEEPVFVASQGVGDDLSRR